MGNYTSYRLNREGRRAHRRPSQQSPQSNEVEPPLYAQLRKGESCDWLIVDAKLQKIGQSVEYVRYRDQIAQELRNESSTVHGHGQAVPMSIILKDISDLQWRHPTSGVTALHVCVCWNPPINVLESFLRLNIQSQHIHMNLAWEKSNKGATPLHYACGNASNIHIIRALIDSACFNTRQHSQELFHIKKRYVMEQTYDKGHTSLHSAVNANASLEVLELLVEICPQVVLMKDKQGFTPLELLCHNFRPLLAKVTKLFENNDINLIHFKNDGRDLSRKIPKRLEQFLWDKIQSGQESALIHILEDVWSKATFLLRVSCSNFMESVPSKFRIVNYSTNDNLIHSIASLPNSCDICPPLMLRLIMASLSDQFKQTHGPYGDLPLHIAARAMAYSFINKGEEREFCSCSSIDYIIKSYPEAVNIQNSNRMLPLEVAISAVQQCSLQHGQKIDYSSFRKMFSANPSALCKLDMNTALYPLLLEKFNTKQSEAENRKDFTNLNVLYQTIKNKPDIMHKI